MSRLAQIRRLIASEGPVGFLHTALRRLIVRRWHVRVFWSPPARLPTTVPWPQHLRYELLPVEAARHIESGQYVSNGFVSTVRELADYDGAYAVWESQKLVSYGAIYVRSPQRSVLGLPESAVLIGNCFTIPSHRGQSIYKLALQATVGELQKAGIKDVFVEVRPENTSSINGIIGAGFNEVKSVDSVIWFASWVWRNGRIQRIHRE